MYKNLFRYSLYFIAVITIAVWSLLAWDHFHGGVPSHHLLAREDLPSISNWWGGILLPLLTWFLLYRIRKRIQQKDLTHSKLPATVLYGFAAALLFGILLSVFFTVRYTDIPGYMMIGLLVMALFIPVYRAECLLGFVIAMTFTFGTVLPTLIGSILALITAVLFLFVRPAIVYIGRVCMSMVSLKKEGR